MEVPNVEKYGGPIKKREATPEQKKAEKEIDRQVVESLKTPLGKIVRKLHREIESNAYSTLIGDDASGRIPTLMLATVLKEICASRDAVPPIVRFMAGSTGLKNKSQEVVEKKTSDLAAHIKQIKESLEKEGIDPKKALIVTDTISSGESMKVLFEAIKENGWDADIAAVGLAPGVDDFLIERKIGTRVITGSQEVPSIYGKSFLSGVTKKIGEIHATPLPDPDNERLRDVRLHAKEIAQTIAKEYLERK